MMMLRRRGAALLLLVALDVAASSPTECSRRSSCTDCVADVLCSWCGSKCLSRNADCTSIAQFFTINCPTNATFTYNDAEVRNVIFPLIGATKGQTESEIIACASKFSADIKHLGRINVTCSPENGDPCNVDTYESPSKQTYIIVPHGSRGETQYLHQAQQFADYLNLMRSSSAGGNIIEYYATGFDSVFENGGLKAKIQQLMAQNPKHTMLVTGHSLGGALATILAAVVAKQKMVPSGQIKLITFGAPRVGDVAFVTELQKMVSYRFRVVNQNDIVPELPPLLPDDAKSMQHNSFEVFYPKGMAANAMFKVCTSNEDPTCRNSVKTSDIKVHASYFDIPIDTWYKTGCTY